MNIRSPTGLDVATMHGLPKDNERGYYFQQDAVVKVNYKIF